MLIVWRRFVHKLRVDELNYRKSLTIIEPDGNGNFPLIRINGEFIRYKPGNHPYALPSDPVGLLPEPEARTRSKREMKIQGQTYPVQGYAPDYQPPTPPRSSSAPGATFEAGANAPRNSETRMIENLRSAKEGRRGKVKSIQKCCNIQPGDTDEYEKWSIVWDNL
jgi:hypothetical protein